VDGSAFDGRTLVLTASGLLLTGDLFMAHQLVINARPAVVTLADEAELDKCVFAPAFAKLPGRPFSFPLDFNGTVMYEEEEAEAEACSKDEAKCAQK
jgi:hypothetical protein